ncbi:T surface-antigen of pili [Sharpea azabuensis]|uniref:T surface-antigen of pili n=2 Tax=Sharpea azabuensis TaxID=322505 RepID=A0A1H6SZX4_9FIRM|nr:T surface-antigen of pili [Sharpea azabuensis]
MPGKTFYIKEVIPDTNKDNELEYDTHEERVQVFISDDGSDNLQCNVQTDSDGITFVNTSKVNYNGKLTVKKIVKDALEENNSFNFYVYLTSDSADLDKKTFNYILDGKSGTFTLNKAGTTDGKFRYRSQQAFKLSNNSVLEMSKLPIGAHYEVTEDDYKSEGYITTKTDNYQGDVSLEGTEVTFTNTRNQIIPTSADTMTHMSFWLIASASAIVLVWILKRKLKASKK